MALSQIQCLDENNVNARTHEGKPEFLYCEKQRLAVEALLRDGREAFGGFLKAHELRGFLSDPELDILIRAVEPYDPGSDVLRSSPVEDGDDDVQLSLRYWPDLSDTSVPELDMGWPDCASYRGVTRANVYTQPPQDGNAHIKEIIRKTIAQAQKVIAVVMDLFTDVDIFRDLLDAGYKRKVRVYILLEHSTLPHFLSMCDRANMHRGHLKNLRVRCAWGGEFLTRSCTRLRGRLGHRFMFVDGDKAVSGSYRFTWMSSRLDRHLITVVTGQAVDAFDRLFRELYGTSSAVDLKQVAMEPEPEADLLPQPIPVAPSAEVARKRHNPMYALLGMGTNKTDPAPTSGPNAPIDSNDKAGVGMKGKTKIAAKAAQVEAPPIHPGLVDLEKAYLIPYLPTWPEPDPPSDVIGFINVRDNSRQTQVHMQRHEMFETSQAIRFSRPYNPPKETLPEVAQLRQREVNLQGVTLPKASATQVSTQEIASDKAQPTSPNTRPSTLATQSSGRDVHMALNTSVDMHCLTSEPKLVNTESKPSSNTTIQQITTPHIDAPTPFSNKAPAIKPGSALATRPIHNTAKETIYTDKQNEHDSGSDHMGTYNPASLHVHASPIAIYQQNTAPLVQPQNRIAHKVSCKQDLSTKPQSLFSKEDFTPSILSPTHSSISASTVSSAQPTLGRLTSPSFTTSVSVTSSFSHTTTTVPIVPPLAAPSPSSPLPPINFHSINTSHPGATPSTSPLTPPVPKPRTLHLLINNGSECNVLNQPMVSGAISEHGKLSGSGLVMDDCKLVFKHKEDATRTQIRPNPEFTSPTKSAEWQNRIDMNTPLLIDVKDELSGEVADRKTAADQKTQSVLTVNTLREDHRPFKEKPPKETENTSQPGNVVRSHRVLDELSRTDSVTKPHNPNTTHVLTDVGFQPNYSQTRTAAASGPAASSHAPENYTVTETQHLRKPNNDTPLTVSTNVVDSILRARPQVAQCGLTPHASIDEAVTNMRVRLNSAKGKAKLDPHTPERPTRPHALELPSPNHEREQRAHEARASTPTAGRLSPCTPTAAWKMPDGRCCPSPGARTPTPDTSDGYISSRDSSTLSTTSDEYFECDEALRPSPVFDQGISLGDTATDAGFRAWTMCKRESEGEREREKKYEDLSQMAKKGSLPLPLTFTKHEESIFYRSPQAQSDPLEPTGADGHSRCASAMNSVDTQTPPPPRRRQSSSSASSENTVSPFITPVPSPAPTPTTKRAATHPRAPTQDKETSRPTVGSRRGASVEGRQDLRRDSRRRSGELTRKWEDGSRVDREKDPELVGTGSGERRSETSTRTSGTQMQKGPWVPRETEGRKVLPSPPRTPQGRPKQQNHHSPVSFRSTAVKPVTPTRSSFTPPSPRSHRQVSSKVDHNSAQTQHNSEPQQPEYRRQSSVPTSGSLKGVDQNSVSKAFSRRSLHYGKPLVGQGSGDLPKPQPSFLYPSTHSQQPQFPPQTQSITSGDQVAQTVSQAQQAKHRQGSASGDLEQADSGQVLSKIGTTISISKLHTIMSLKNKGTNSPTQTKRSPDSSAQPRKNMG